MDNVNNVDNCTNNTNLEVLTSEKILKIKENQGFNESNLMTLPFISLKRAKTYEINRTWIRDGKEIGLKVKGSTHGCPTIYELDVIMALFRIQSKNVDNKLVVLSQKTLDKEGEIINQTNKVTNLSKVINFTYRGLAREMGLKGWGNATKKRLEKSIECLNECTVYSTLAIRDQEQGEYIIDFEGVESSRIFKNYKSYSVTKFKKANKELLSPNEVEEAQSIEIDDFFFKNITNNFFKVYDYEAYRSLKMAISKKLLLILTQWSHGNEKYITTRTLYDYIGLDGESEKECRYNYAQLKKAMQELKDINFIQGYIASTNGVNFVFNTTRRIDEKGLNKYTNDNECVGRLREIGVSYEDITKYCRLDTMGYISALLRYVDYKEKKGQVKDILKFTLKGLPFERYDIGEFTL